MAPNPRALVLVILICFIFFSPDTQAPTLTRPSHLVDHLDYEYRQLGVLNHSSWTDFNPSEGRWLNFTGFRAEDGYAWQTLDIVRGRVREKAATMLGDDTARIGIEDGVQGMNLPLYRNISGSVHGQWVRVSPDVYNMTAPVLNRTSLGVSSMYDDPALPFSRNITGKHGSMYLQFAERDVEFLEEHDGVKQTKALLGITDDASGGSEWEMTLHGLHYIDTGFVILTTTSDKFAGIFGTPHLTLSEVLFNRSLSMMNDTLRNIIEMQASSPSVVVNPWSSNIDGASDGLYAPPHCEYVVYILQQPLNMPEEKTSSSAQHPLEFVEKELRHPSGYIYRSLPDMRMEVAMFSPDCGFVLESKGPPDYPPSNHQHLYGPKYEVIIAAKRWLSLLFGALIGGQIYFSLLQMKTSATPSTRSRISFYAIGLISTANGCIAFGFLIGGIATRTMFLNLYMLSFLGFLSASILDVRFLMDIWTVQDDQRRQQARQNASASNSNGARQNGAVGQSNDAPSRARATNAATQVNLMSGATPVMIPSDQDDLDEGAADNTTTDQSPSRRFTSLYGRFSIVIIITIMVSLHATSWPIALRTAYTNTMMFIFLSPWVFQIYRNTMRNCRKALLWRYVVGQSILRLVPIAYFYGVEDNIWFSEIDRTTLLVFAGWIWIQIWVLAVQNLFGPRVFVKSSWVPPAYDYHPILREDEEDASMPLGFTQASDLSASVDDLTKEKIPGQKTFDCAICMQVVDVQVVQGLAGTSEASSLGLSALARRAYMVTPCRHIFHTDCLEGWMRFRLQCPICRETLPAL